MATQFPKQEFQILIHGNNDFKCSELLEKLSISQQNTEDIKMKFMAFSDLNLFQPYTPIEPPKDHELNVKYASAILVLVSQTEIFSDGMRQLICNLPYNPFYGLNKKNEKMWWKGVIVVFSLGENEGGDKLVKQSISGNRGVREIVDKAGGRYIWMSDNTKCEDFAANLQAKVANLSKGLFVGYSDQSVMMISGFQEKVNKIKSGGVIKFDHTFILFGGINSGKSTLGNLLLGPRKSPPFETHLFKEQSGLTKDLKKFETKIKGSVLYGGDTHSNKDVRIQIIDQPGFDCLDPKVHGRRYGEILAECMHETTKTSHITFLLLIDINSEDIQTEYFEIFIEVTQVLSDWIASNPGMDLLSTQTKNAFFSNAIIIFTHADGLNWQMDKNILEEKLQKKKESSLTLRNLLQHPNQRYIFINGANNAEENRNWILRKMVKTITKEKEPIKYPIPVNQVNREKIHLDKNISDALNKLNKISQDLPLFVLLICPEYTRNEKMYDFILSLVKNSDFQKIVEGILDKDFWDHICIIFKGKRESYPEDNQLKELIDKAKFGHFYVEENASSAKIYEEFSKLICQTKLKPNEKQESILEHDEKEILKNMDEDTSCTTDVEIKSKELTNAVVMVSTHTLFCDHSNIPLLCFTLRNIKTLDK